MSALPLYRLDGAYCRPADDETAFSGGRSPRYGVFIVGLAPDAGLLDADRRWVRGLWEALRPHAIGSGDGYINGITDFSDDRVRQSYGPAKYERLARIKAQYDPGNLFHLNANIRPPDLARHLRPGQRTDLTPAKARAVSEHSHTLRGANWCWRPSPG